ncbi:hippurate hydrolase [Sediminihabitans luteus]|uniref:Hippurate hydrolase n=1 Tax=Sediminihabitans luteus TaxID=1138585 RepID=A0A2M9CBZ1_9CELL|nr:amidohydrolase [Sediminihabitans luteus]PJJ68599.1 hippurate hydrolase [Sediminihabitans luteus]GII99937.1 hippurate hydrolase [Sediminihabitans luteus]
MTALTTSDLTEIYTDLHRHPELAYAEHRTAGIVAERLRGWGFDVHEGVGGTGVVGVLGNGEGPRVLLRADMDGLPVTEATGLPYASTDTATTPDGVESGTMHACGHDVHVTCLLGAASRLAAAPETWSGTLIALFQPAEEVGSGARTMLADGLYDRIGGAPDVVLGQHVMPLPVGVVNLTAGPAMAAADSLRVTLHGRGGHGSSPEATVDPVVMAAATVMRLQGVVAREVGANEGAVVTVGALRSGTQANIIPASAELLVNVRTFDASVRERVLGAIRRIVEAESAASGAPAAPEIESIASFSAMANDPEASERTRAVLARVLEEQRGTIESAGGVPAVISLPPAAGSEDVGELATAVGVPLVYWNLGGWDPQAFAGFDLAHASGMGDLPAGVAPNHSPFFAPVPEPTLELGAELLVEAAVDRLR